MHPLSGKAEKGAHDCRGVRKAVAEIKRMLCCVYLSPQKLMVGAVHS